jgi:thiol:disulfide interchange protein/DsbC/DsbD-like thiol-disulfide interchange protein
MYRGMTAIRIYLLALVTAFSGGSAHGAQNTRATLMTEARAVRAGESTMVGVRLEMNEGWHTYWVNPGESGGATEVKWELPAGMTVGALQWPVPEEYEVAGIVTYVYHGEVLLMAPLHVASTVLEGTYELKAKVNWLECAELCLPGGADVSVRFEVGEATEASKDSQRFEQARLKLPSREPPEGLQAAWAGAGAENERAFVVRWRKGEGAADPGFFALPGDGYEVAPRVEALEAAGDEVGVRVKLTRQGEGWPARVSGLIIERFGPKPVAYEVSLALGTGEDDGTGVGVGGVDGAGPALWLMLWFAFLGGLILNLMPCVLPVIALKVMGFMNQVRQSPGEVRRHGLVYGAGVLVSFLVLAGMVVVIGGRAASWGMQFQSPQFLVVMTTLVTLVALNLFGVFEVHLGGRAMGAASQLASRTGTAGAFFHGMLATALATPCTAPFLGVALGFAFLQPPWVVVLMFLMVGWGLAMPYVVLSFVPGLARWLPKPGVWMEHFKVAMGFPMAATAFWLLSLLGRHYGNAGVLWVGVYLVFVALGLWVWGQFVQRGTGERGRGLTKGLSVALVILGYWVALEHQLGWRNPVAPGGSGAVVRASGGIAWEPWRPEAVEEARSEGRPVLVDFTADWCVTCQANKKTSLEIASVRKKLEEIGAVALLGDYTLRDDAILAELQRWGRAGVPLVLVYPRDESEQPRVLPELLTPGVVLDALEWAR